VLPKLPPRAFSTRKLSSSIQMMKALLLSLVAGSAAMELTPDNWDSAVAGKTVFIKFLAPW